MHQGVQDQAQYGRVSTSPTPMHCFAVFAASNGVVAPFCGAIGMAIISAA